MLPDRLVQLSSFGYTFWLSYTINYSKVKSASVLVYDHNSSSGLDFNSTQEFSQFRQSKLTNRETPPPLYNHSQAEVLTIYAAMTKDLKQVSRCQIPGTASLDMKHTETAHIAK